MPAPQRIRLNIDDLRISAYVVVTAFDPAKDKLICRKCAPIRTRMKAIADIVQHGLTGDYVTTVFECQTCQKQWAVSYMIPKPVEGEVQP